MKQLIILISVFLTAVLPLHAQGGGKVVVSGFIQDAVTGEPLPQAVVYLEDKKVGVAADDVGRYSISVTPGSHILYCAYFGYKTQETPVTVHAEGMQVDFKLELDRTILEAATIFSSSKRQEIQLPQLGKQRVDAIQVRQMPALMGEADLIRVIQMLPGVQAPGEGSTGFSVRGGGTDQNLILVDGAPVYNCGHFLGFLSMFNGDVIRGADLYKGDFPVTYGGRLSSVLDVSIKDGNNQAFGGNASIGLLTSKICLEGPIVPEKLSFLLAGRRSYLDLFFPLLKGKLPEDSKLYFYDWNAKLSWRAGEKDRVYLSAFSGRDALGLSLSEFGLGKTELMFANHTQSLRWNHVCSPTLTSDLLVYNSLYRNDIGVGMEGAAFDFRQKIRETGVKSSWTWHLNEANTLKVGVQISRLIIEPGNTTPRDEASLIQEMKIPYNYAFNPCAWLQNEQKLGSLTVRYGLRFSWFILTGPNDQKYLDPETHELTEIHRFGVLDPIQTYFGLEPRISASLPVTPDLSFKAAYARSFQYLQQTRVSVTGSPIDSWIAASPNTKPQRSDQYSAGINALMANQALELSLEGFYKDNRNTPDFVDNPGLVFADPDREALLRFGKSWAYGAEAMIRYDFARWNGWLSYTWSKSWYKIPEINEGKPYLSPLNHEHAVNFVLTFDFSKRFSASTEWIFYSGAPTTYPEERFLFKERWVRIYSERNADRLPDYHRLDFSLVYRTARRVEGKRWGVEWNLSIYNAYARHNAWSVFYQYDEKPEALRIYLFTIIPSLSCNIQF